MKQIVLDFETQSEANLKKVGGVKYAEDPSTRILCAGFKIDDNVARLFGDCPPTKFYEAARDPKVIWIAHNALFEQSIYEFVLRKNFPDLPPLPPSRWKCTAAKAAACALPRNLENAALVMRLPIQKNMEGNRLMKKYMKPRRAWVKWREENPDAPDDVIHGAPDKYFSNRDELQKIFDYCMTDVDAEWHLDRSLPDLIPIEREIWIMNQEMNLRGIQVDCRAVAIILSMIAKQTTALQAEIKQITDGAVTTANQRNRILDWLEEQGVALESLTAKSVAETIEAMSDSPARRVLEIRRKLSKSSTKKYQAILARAGKDQRVRDLALYHGAHTGRESGTGIQIHNLPKGNIKNTDRAIDCIIKWGDVDFLESLYGDSFQVFSACVRGMVTASLGHKLFVADYNAIEARVLAWISRDEKTLKMFRDKIDPYVARAAQIFNIDQLDDVTPEQRFVGKIAELALGYGMGADKFFATCHSWGATWVTMEIATRAVRNFRTDRAAVVKLWAMIERAAIMAVRSPWAMRMGQITWAMSGPFLECRLPSGRRLRYHRPEIRNEATPWGRFRPRLYYWAVNSLTKKWECGASYGGLLTENVVQAIARDIALGAALRLKSEGYEYLFQVHDELVSESKDGDVEEFESLLTDLPTWAEGLPVTAKGWTGFRYKKN